MSKVKTTFFCQNCGAQHVKWMGQCPACNEWNTIVEEIVQKRRKKELETKQRNQKRKTKRFRLLKLKSTKKFGLTPRTMN